MLFWVVWDAKKAALEVASYQVAIQWAAETALRDIIGTTTLGDLLSDRQMVDEYLQKDNRCSYHAVGGDGQLR